MPKPIPPIVGTITAIASEARSSRSMETLPGVWITIQKTGTKGPAPTCRERHWIPDSAGTRSLLFEAHLQRWPVYVDDAGLLHRAEEVATSPEPQHADVKGQCQLFEEVPTNA